MVKRRFRKGVNIGAFTTEVLQKAEWTALGEARALARKPSVSIVTETPPSWAVTWAQEEHMGLEGFQKDLEMIVNISSFHLTVSRDTKSAMAIQILNFFPIINTFLRCETKQTSSTLHTPRRLMG